MHLRMLRKSPMGLEHLVIGLVIRIKIKSCGCVLLNMQVTASPLPVLGHTTDSLAAEYLATKETNARICQLFPGRWTLSPMCLFHQYVEVFWQAD